MRVDDFGSRVHAKDTNAGFPPKKTTNGPLLEFLGHLQNKFECHAHVLYASPQQCQNVQTRNNACTVYSEYLTGHIP